MKKIIIILVILIVGGGLFYYYGGKQQTNMNQNNSEQAAMEAVYWQQKAGLQDQHKSHEFNGQDFEKFKSLSYFSPSLSQEGIKDAYSFAVSSLQPDDPTAKDLKFLEIRDVPANMAYLADKVYIATYKFANPDPEFKDYTGLEFILFKNVGGSWKVAGNYPTQYKDKSEIDGLLEEYYKMAVVAK